MPHGFGCAALIFAVTDLGASIDYYVKVLGFRVDWADPGVIASVSRNQCCIFLCQGDQGHPGSWTWIGVGDVSAVFEEFRGKGATVRHPPTNYSWAYEMQIEDLDGNVLRLGSEPKADEPHGPWRDMRGELWMPSGDGRWQRQT
jgi:catechol 2,3-dioxygenase-like lactoylglutathione lyase family enzyme